LIKENDLHMKKKTKKKFLFLKKKLSDEGRGSNHIIHPINSS
jgi:hypothetical protein